MTYVRTKDGRIGKVISVRDYNGPYPTYYHVSFQNDKEIYNDYELDIIKQAYTIEELCDEFVTVSKNHKYCTITDIRRDNFYAPKIPMYYAGEHTHDFVDNYIKNGGTIYGAIWTDRGLIYVAKMNDKGELELL